ncbi:MAG: hypothetical protein LBC41_00465 [Clostridiales bacterium]|jgi:hypothetical protein|nr:hypothetical protein [Clostridiales bacterium]MDR2749105.1 hypothetical protein [Clostridiales bacterium]
MNFALSLNTLLDLASDFGEPGKSAIAILRRDMANVFFSSPDCPENRIRFVHDSALNPEGYRQETDQASADGSGKCCFQPEKAGLCF